MPAAPRPQQAEALDLPELDKGDDAEDVDVGTFELSLGDEPETDAAEARETADTFEVDIQVLTDSGSNEAAADLDVGVDDLLDALPEVPRGHDSEAPPATGTDLDLHLDTPLESDDPSSDAELGDDGLEALPELMNEEGDGDAGPDVDRTFLPTAPEGEIPRAASYESEWLLLGAPCHALWAGADVVLAASEHLMRFGVERKSDGLPAGVRISSLGLLANGNVLMATTRGLLELGPTGNYSFAEAPEATRGSGSDIVELGLPQGEHSLWARLSSGALLRRRAGQWQRHETGGEVRALTCNEQCVTLLVISRRPTLQLSADGGSSFRELILPEPAATVALGLAPNAVSRGAIVALADAQRGLCVSNDGGETFRMVLGAVNVTAVALGEHEGSPTVFAALHRESRDVTEVIAVEPATARAVSVAELSGQPDEEAEETGRTQALVFSNGYLWAGGGYGLARLKR